jgi:hypothetical protein
LLGGRRRKTAVHRRGGHGLLLQVGASSISHRINALLLGGVLSGRVRLLLQDRLHATNPLLLLLLRSRSPWSGKTARA